LPAPLLDWDPVLTAADDLAVLRDDGAERTAPALLNGFGRFTSIRNFNRSQ
jgi:hypothetical protein